MKPEFRVRQEAARVLEQSTTGVGEFRLKVDTVSRQELDAMAEDHRWAGDVETIDEEKHLQG